MSQHDQNKSRHNINILEDINFGEGIDLAVGLAATALTTDQLVKLAHTKKHTSQHLVKGGVGVALATAAFAMMAREYRGKREKQHEKKRRRLSLVERSRPWSIEDAS